MKEAAPTPWRTPLQTSPRGWQEAEWSACSEDLQCPGAGLGEVASGQAWAQSTRPDPNTRVSFKTVSAIRKALAPETSLNTITLSQLVNVYELSSTVNTSISKKSLNIQKDLEPNFTSSGNAGLVKNSRLWLVQHRLLRPGSPQTRKRLPAQEETSSHRFRLPREAPGRPLPWQTSQRILQAGVLHLFQPTHPQIFR